MEGRGLAKGNTAEQNTSRTQRRTSAPSALDRVREAAKRDKKAKFTALFHHITVDRLRDAYHALSRVAAAGVDGVTWVRYGDGLEDNLLDLHARLHRGAYRAKARRQITRILPRRLKKVGPSRPSMAGFTERTRTRSTRGVVAGSAALMAVTPGARVGDTTPPARVLAPPTRPPTSPPHPRPPLLDGSRPPPPPAAGNPSRPPWHPSTKATSSSASTTSAPPSAGGHGSRLRRPRCHLCSRFRSPRTKATVSLRQACGLAA